MLPTYDIKHPMVDKQEMLSRASTKCNSTMIWQLCCMCFWLSNCNIFQAQVMIQEPSVV